MPTPELRGKAARRFIKSLEANKGNFVYPSAKKADLKKLAEIVADIEREARDRMLCLPYPSIPKHT